MIDVGQGLNCWGIATYWAVGRAIDIHLEIRNGMPVETEELIGEKLPYARDILHGLGGLEGADIAGNCAEDTHLRRGLIGTLLGLLAI